MSAGAYQVLEFRCIECERDIIRFGDGDALCAMCLHMPGWFRHEELRSLLDPDHDGRDPAELLDARPPQPAP